MEKNGFTNYRKSYKYKNIFTKSLYTQIHHENENSCIYFFIIVNKVDFEIKLKVILFLLNTIVL